jgi:hypothetical protein
MSTDRKWSQLRRWLREQHAYYVAHSDATKWMHGSENARAARMVQEVLDHMTDQLAEERRRRRKAR